MKTKSLLFLASIFILSACTSVTLSPANFAWPIESVLTTDATGKVVIDRYSTEFNASNLFKAEFGDSTEVANKEIRIIRDQLGYYVMTAKGFMNVYVFEVNDGAFKLANKVFVTKEGLSKPALNQREPYIEVLDGENKYIIGTKGTARQR